MDEPTQGTEPQRVRVRVRVPFDPPPAARPTRDLSARTYRVIAMLGWSLFAAAVVTLFLAIPGDLATAAFAVGAGVVGGLLVLAGGVGAKEAGAPDDVDSSMAATRPVRRVRRR